MNIRSLVTRIRALAAKVPTNKHAPRLCVVTSDDPADVREAKLATAERTGDLILDVELYEPSEVAL